MDNRYLQYLNKMGNGYLQSVHLLVLANAGNLLNQVEREHFKEVFFPGYCSILYPSKLPQNDSPDPSSYGEDFLGVLQDHYGKERAAKSIEGECLL